VQKEETYKKSCKVAITKAKTTSFKACR